MAFVPGGIAQLKSGSPALTVIAVDGEVVEIMWFAEEVAEFRTQKIPALALDALEIEEFEDEEEEDDDEEDEDAH